MRPSSDRLLELIAAGIDHDILPELQTSSGREAARIILVLLAELRARERVVGPILAERVAQAPKLLSGLTGQQLSDLAKNLTDLAAELKPEASVEQLWTAYTRSAQILSKAIDALIIQGSDTSWDAIETCALWERTALLELLAAQDAASRISRAERVELNPETVQAWLDEREILPPSMRVCGNVRALPGGFSKGTFTFEVSDAYGDIQPLVLRRNEVAAIDPQACFLQGNEYRLMRLFYDIGIRVPRVIAFEPEHGMLGGDTTLMERAPGENFGDVMASRGIFTTAMAKDMAAALAALHTVDVALYSDLVSEIYGAEAVGVSIGERNKQLLAAHEAYWRSSTASQSPMISRAFAWLRRNITDNPAPACFIHGDFGMHNLLFDDGKVSAILDWETAQVGDPAQELAYLRDPVAALMPWEEFISFYRQAGGQHIDPTHLRFHLAARWLRNAVISDVARGRLEDGAYDKLALGWLSTTLQPQFLLKADDYAR